MWNTLKIKNYVIKRLKVCNKILKIYILLWKAEIIFKNKKYYLGRYENKQDAIKARKEAEEKMHKKFLKDKNLL